MTRGRVLAVSLVAGVALAAAGAPGGGAANECHGISPCVPIGGPWVVVRSGAPSTFLLTCPSGVVVGIDAVATSSSVRVTFDGRIGVPIKPGVTTTSKAYFRAVSTSRGVEAFQPWIGCVPSKSSKGRTTVSARVSPGPDLDRRARIVVVHPGSVSIGSVGCPAGEPLVGSWDALGFLTKDPPDLRAAGLVNVTREVSGGKVVVTAGATDSLRTDAHAVVQAGAVCAP